MPDSQLRRNDSLSSSADTQRVLPGYSVSIDSARRELSKDLLIVNRAQSNRFNLSSRSERVTGVIVAGGELNEATQKAVQEASSRFSTSTIRFVAYEEIVKIGGSLAWRANNPGNLRDAPNKIGTIPGAIGTFAVFGSFEDGRGAQRELYLSRYGDRTVREAVEKLTPPTENNTARYLNELRKAGVDLDQSVRSQIGVFMDAVAKNEGVVEGVEVKRLP